MKREKLAFQLVICTYIVMAVAMFISYRIFGYNYNNKNLYQIIFYFEIIMSVLAYLYYEKLNLKSLTAVFKFSFWQLPLLFIILAVFVATVYTGDFSNKLFKVFSIALTTLLVGFSEEMVFRGILLPILLEKRTILRSVVISSLLFSGFHLVNLLAGIPITNTLIQLVHTFIFGIIFACIFILSKNIIPQILFHAIWDFCTLSQGIIHANIAFILAIVPVIEILICIPLVIYTIKNKNSTQREI